ncbi:FAD-binding domain-containing protein [Pseudoscourfieldia marina]
MRPSSLALNHNNFKTHHTLGSSCRRVPLPCTSRSRALHRSSRTPLDETCVAPLRCSSGGSLGDDDDTTSSLVTTGSPNVLVVGAGPVGTTAACLLSDRLGPSASVTILERRSDPTRMDDASRMSARLYPMALNERSFDALARARLEDIQGGHKLRGFAVLTKEGRVKQFNLPGQDEDKRILIDWVTWTSNLITLARQKHPRINFQFDTPLRPSAFDVDAQTVTLDDGTVMKYDLLVGADGANSVVRTALYGDACTKVLYDGTNVGYRILQGVDPSYLTNDMLRAIYDNDDNTARIFRCGSKKTSIVLFRSCVDPSRIDAMYTGTVALLSDATAYSETVHAIEGLPHSVALAIAASNAANAHNPPSSFGQVRWMREFGKGHVALVGDAAHSVTSSLGQGATTGLGSAVALADAINTDDIAGSVSAYSASRAPQAHALQRMEVLNAYATSGWRNPNASKLWSVIARAASTLGLIGGLLLSRVNSGVRHSTLFHGLIDPSITLRDLENQFYKCISLGVCVLAILTSCLCMLARARMNAALL